MVRDKLNAMHRAREEFLKYGENERLKRVLRYNRRSSEGTEFQVMTRIITRGIIVKSGMD